MKSKTKTTDKNNQIDKISIGINPYVLTFRGNVLSRLVSIKINYFQTITEVFMNNHITNYI